MGALTGNVTGNTSGSSGSCTGNAATATLATDATSFTVSANNSTNETVYPVFVDGATGSQGAETDTGLTYNPSTGNLTSTKFTGDGSGLTGITASGSGVVIKHDGSTVGTAGTINFGTNLDVSAISGGAVTITASGGSGSGISTISGVVNIVNDLDVDGHTNLDNVSISGISTATGGSVFGDIQAGVSGLNATIQKTNNSGLYLQYDKPGALILCNGGGTVSAMNNFSVAGLSTMTGGAKLGVLSVGYDSLNATIQPLSGNNTLYFNYNNGTEVRIGEGQTRSDLIVKGDIEPKTDSAFDLGTTSVRWRNVYADTLYGDGSNLTGVNANVGITTNLSGTFTASAGSPSTINTFGYGSGDIVVEYTVFIKNGSNFQTQKLLAMRDGTTIHSTQFAVMFSSSLLVQLDATISSGNILLRATPETGVSGSTTYKVKREVM